MGTNEKSDETNNAAVIEPGSEPPSEASGSSNHTYQSAWKQLLNYTKSLEAEMGTRFRKRFKQSLIRYELLSQLFRIAPNGLPIGQLAQRMMGSNGNITGLVDRMILEGLVKKSSSQEDRRSMHVILTEKGTELCTTMDLAHADWAESLMQKKLTIEEAEQIIQLVGECEEVNPS